MLVYFHNLFNCDVYTVVLNDPFICDVHIVVSNKHVLQMCVYSVHENIFVCDNVFAMLIWTNDNIFYSRVAKEAK